MASVVSMKSKIDDIHFMMQEDFKVNAMREMGWDVDAEIPMASAENLQILKDLEKMQELKFEFNEQIKTYDERDKAIQRHKRNIELALNQNQTLYNTVKADVHKEQHLLKLAHLERTKVTEDLNKNQKELDEYTAYKEQTERQISLRKSEIDQLTNRIKSAKTALLEWNEAMDDGNKGYQLIEKYFKDDQQRARELNTRRQNLQNDIDICRKRVVVLYDEQNTLEKNLERTASLYRAAHLERRQMVETWKSAVQQMVQREKDIQNGEDRHLELQMKAERKAIEYASYDDRLNDIMANNREVEATIEALNSDTSDIKVKIQQIVDQCYLKQREMENLQKELHNLNSQVEQQRTENRLRQKEKIQKQAEMDNFDEVLARVQGRLTAMENKNLDASQRLQLLEEMNDNEDKTLSDISKEAQRLSGLLFRTQREVYDLRDKEKISTVNTAALNATLIALERNTRNLEKEIQRQTELHYTLAFKYLESERKLASIQGTMVDPEVEERNQEHLIELEAQLTKLHRRMQVTEAQNKKLNYSMNSMVNAFNSDNIDLEKVKYDIKEAQVYCEGTVKRLKLSQAQNQELIVELSLLKMHCKDMELEIEKCMKGQFNLEQHRLQINRAAKDRMAELKSQRDLLNMKRKHLSDELSTLRADMGERQKHIDAMRSRFELTAKLLGTNEDGTLVTTTQLKVESAQQKQMLADEGDELNKKVLKAEKEVVALENTLRMFDKSNDNYRKSLGKDNTFSDKASDALQQLQVDYCKELNTLKMLRCKYSRLEQQYIAKQDEYEHVELEMKRTLDKRDENTAILEKLERDLATQKGRIARAEREIHSELRRLKRSDAYITQTMLVEYDRDLDLQDLEQRNMRALNALCDMAMSDEIGSIVFKLICKKGLQLPQHLKNTRSSMSVASSGGRDQRMARERYYEECDSSQISVISLNFDGD